MKLIFSFAVFTVQSNIHIYLRMWHFPQEKGNERRCLEIQAAWMLMKADSVRMLTVLFCLAAHCDMPLKIRF